MDIMELGAIGELVGGVAVVASPLYVGVQVRHSTAVARAVSHHGIIDSFNEFRLAHGRRPRSDSRLSRWNGHTCHASASLEEIAAALGVVGAVPDSRWPAAVVEMNAGLTVELQ